ncbi:MAG: Zn-dependent exopeptidase M28 [Peptococcaceae bacterium]|nr:Zn-dependent exopeptidase M28 [Peptococcaceae bacterium]
MKSRRTFIKMLAGIGAFVIPWTTLPRYWGQKAEYLLGEPPVKLYLPSDMGQNSKKPSPEVLAKKAIEDIRVLCNPDMQGRRAGTAGETRTLVYLQEQLEALQLKAYGNDHYWQMFSIPPTEERIINNRALFRPDESDNLRIPAANILAGLPGRNREEAIILSAHLDHLGIYKGKLCPGANDNASGVGCVLEVMRRLVKESAQGTRPYPNIVAAFWSAEEMGFLGSKYFVKKPTIPLSQIKAVVNLDTVGNGQKKDFILWETGDSPLTNKVKEAMLKNGAEIELAGGQGNNSDQSSFIGTGVPAVTILSKDWLWKNHTPEDNISLINEEKLETACNVLYDVVKKIAF